MLADKARNFLKKITTQSTPPPEQILDAESDKVNDGSYNSVTFHHLLKETSDSRKSSSCSSTVVAYSKPKKTMRPYTIQRAIGAENMMFRKGVPHEFNQYCIYYFPDGRKISAKAEEKDLNFYIVKRQKKLSYSSVIHMIAQAILAVYDLHIRNIVHRDIKPENFLVFSRGLLKLADHDTAAEVNDAGLPLMPLHINGTESYMTPEIKLLHDRVRSLEADIDKLNQGEEKPQVQEIKKLKTQIKKCLREYVKLNFKIGDCFALGNTIEKMTLLLPEIEQLNHPLLDKLYQGLKENKLTVNDAINFPIFGATPEKRQAYFNHVREQAKKGSVLIIDGYDFVPVAPGDPFYILDREIKYLYRASQFALCISEEIEHCQESIRQGSGRNISETMRQFALLNHNTLLFSTKKTDVAKYKDDLDELKSIARTQREEILANFFRDEDLTTRLLKNAVDDAYFEYVHANGLEDKDGHPVTHTFDFMHLHLPAGRLQAQTFQKFFEGAFMQGASPQHLFHLIYKHYTTGPGNTYPQSFKTFLHHHLKKLKDDSMPELKKYFDTLNQNSGLTIASSTIATSPTVGSSFSTRKNN